MKKWLTQLMARMARWRAGSVAFVRGAVTVVPFGEVAVVVTLQGNGT